jgi:hypothetical protein
MTIVDQERESIIRFSEDAARILLEGKLETL